VSDDDDSEYTNVFPEVDNFCGAPPHIPPQLRNIVLKEPADPVRIARDLLWLINCSAAFAFAVNR
jgi:hypothetical protein